MRGWPCSHGWMDGERSHHQAGRSRVPGIKYFTNPCGKWTRQREGRGFRRCSPKHIAATDHASSRLSYHLTWDPKIKQPCRMYHKNSPKMNHQLPPEVHRAVAQVTSIRQVYNDSYDEPPTSSAHTVMCLPGMPHYSRYTITQHINQLIRHYK